MVETLLLDDLGLFGVSCHHVVVFVFTLQLIISELDVKGTELLALETSQDFDLSHKMFHSTWSRRL